jgi:hypothetical protein
MDRPRLFPFPSYVAPMLNVRTALQRPCPPWGTPAPASDSSLCELSTPVVRLPELLLEVPRVAGSYKGRSRESTAAVVSLGDLEVVELTHTD